MANTSKHRCTNATVSFHHHGVLNSEMSSLSLVKDDKKRAFTVENFQPSIQTDNNLARRFCSTGLKKLLHGIISLVVEYCGTDCKRI